MPIISRPDSDVKRQQALSVAKAKADTIVLPLTPAFSAATLAHLVTFLPNFSQQMLERGSALSAQAAVTAAANLARAELVMYVKHFIHVFNMGVDRGVYPATDRAHYQLDTGSGKIPALGTDAQRMQWGSNMVDGDAARVLAGGAPMSNPTAAEVAAKLSALGTQLSAQTVKKDAYDKEQEDVDALWAEADELIDDIWDEVLFTFRKDDAPSMRRKAREYGVVYRLSSGEPPTPEEYSVQGTVTAPNAAGTNEPLADVQVTVMETSDAVITHADGTYLIPQLPDGNYNLQYKKPDYITQTLPTTVTAGSIVTMDVVMMADVPPVP